MRASKPVETLAIPPDPGSARTLDDLVERLRWLRVWAGNPSYETVKNRINRAWTDAGRPASELTKKSTVIDCFRPGRRRLNTDLVLAAVRALHPDPGYVVHWRQALRVVGAETQAASQVRGQDTLPDDLAEFTGRSAELDLLRRTLRRGAAGDDAVVIAAIEGMAGVGKTRLAIHAGHLLTRENPVDQVLFVDLRGFHPDPAQPPADPAAVLDSFLRLLGIPGQQIPHGVDARAAVYRQRLAGRRALVVLDNAADEDQVRPLLSDSPSCLTLITSRRRLAGPRWATQVVMDVFTPDEAVTFLERAAPGMSGATADAARVARRCGYLPLALGLLTGHMRAKPDWTVADHVDWLDERHRDRKLDDGVELAFSLSYQHLPTERRRLLRLLALHPGHDTDAYAAAALTDATVDTTGEHLNRLAADHLLQQHTPGRFAFHDLVRAYASACASDEDRPPVRRAALTRLFDHYLRTASAAMATLWPAEGHLRPPVRSHATPTPPMPDSAAARRWLDTERVNLVATIGYTATHGWPRHTTQLAATLYRYLDTAGRYSETVTVHTYARDAAHHSGDRSAEANALTNLGTGFWRQGRFVEAADCYQQAVTLSREMGDRLGEARALTNLTGVYWRLGRYREAADRAEQALTLLREIGNPQHEAYALNGLGLVLERQGRHPQATDHLLQALTLFRENGNRHGEANSLTNLGLVHRALGSYQQAAEHHRQALTLFRDLGDLGGQADALNGLGETLLADSQPAQARNQHTTALTLANQLGDQHEQARAHDGLAHTYHATNDPIAAHHHWQRALAIYTDLHAPEADQILIHLDNRQPRRPPKTGPTGTALRSGSPHSQRSPVE